MQLKKISLVFVCSLMGCVHAGNVPGKPAAGKPSLVYDATRDGADGIDPEHGSDDDGSAVDPSLVDGSGGFFAQDGSAGDDDEFETWFNLCLRQMESGEPAANSAVHPRAVAGSGEGAAEGEVAFAGRRDPMNVSGEQRDQLVWAFGEDLTARYLSVTRETKDAVRRDIIATARKKNPDAYKDDLELDQLEMSLELLVKWNAGETFDEDFICSMVSHTKALSDRSCEDAGVQAGASPAEVMRAQMHKILASEGLTDLDRSLARLVLARLNRFEHESSGLEYQNLLAQYCSSRSSRDCSIKALRCLEDDLDGVDSFSNFFQEMGNAIMSINLAVSKGESLPAGALLFLMGGSGLVAPRLSLQPINAWTSGYLRDIVRAAQSEEISAGARRYFAAQEVVAAARAVLQSERAFSVRSELTVGLYKAIEEYLAFRESSSALVSARR